MTETNSRQAEYSVDPLFLNRWSPRAFTGEAVPEKDLLTILDAARWAPSAFNSQPWRFVYGIKGTPAFDTLLGLLNDFNQSWAKDAGAVVVLLSKTHLLPPGASAEVPSYSHTLDAGAAWGIAALQATRLGYFTHGMTGVHFDKVQETLGVPDGHRAELAFVVGKRGDKSKLPEGLAAREEPSPRKPLAELAFEGSFKA
ncbi:nitroreductase family protein [Rhizobiaceae bacterium BDR2-2]|uniref:Nitroreductase family protein n=1 Tax=Ectorhizobium quercum TaxID=2965071 RepID=A0AAE3N3X2_9HYPH|nr:nitroreductase family protein [Ectorhizobium quercum]MCX8999481.1 nitroreductase family protein [Ectorhizobium quercum]